MNHLSFNFLLPNITILLLNINPLKPRTIYQIMAYPQSLSPSDDFDFGAGAESSYSPLTDHINHPIQDYIEPTILDLQSYFHYLHPPITAEEWHYDIAFYFYQEARILELQNALAYQQAVRDSSPPELQPREWHDSLFASPQRSPYRQLLCSPQLEDGETVLTSIELPPIRDLISFPWTPVGVELPPLRFGVKIEEG